MDPRDLYKGYAAALRQIAQLEAEKARIVAEEQTEHETRLSRRLGQFEARLKDLREQARLLASKVRDGDMPDADNPAKGS